MDLVKKFSDVCMKDVMSVGGKNASLGEMIKNLSIRKINDPEKVIQLVIEAIEKAGYKPGKDIYISLDSAASSFYNNGKYNMGIGEFTSDEMIKYYKKLINKYPIISIEDGLGEDDWLGWEKMQKEMGDKITLIGDDIFVTNTKLLQKGIDLKAANSILIKPNQIGTLTSAIDAIKLAEVNNFSWVVSHRSGETLDTTIADIAYSTSAFGLKTGSPHQSPDCLDRDDVRRTKYLRMAGLEIKKYLEDNFSEKLLKNDSKVVDKIVKYYNSLENGYFKQVVYEYLQHAESKISAKVLAEIQFNLDYVLDVLIEIFEGRKAGNMKSAARQIIEIAEKRTFAGLKVENEMVKQAKQYISKNAEVLKCREYEKIKDINLWDNDRFGVLCLIRHGETSWSEAVLNKFAAWHQSMITEKGKKEAFEAGVKVKKLGVNFNFGFCSDLLRSQETLKLFSKGLDIEDKLNVIENCNIKERNYGMLMGWNRECLSNLVGEKQFKTWRRGYDTDESRPGLGENLMDVKERTIKYFSENVLSKIFDGSNVVLSAHGNSLRSILVYLKELNLGRKLKTEEVMQIEAPLSLPIFIVFDKKTKQIKECWLDSDDKVNELGKVLSDSDLSGRDLECKETNPLFIKSIEAEEVFDSRNKSTIKVRIRLNNDLVGTWAMVPAGKSTGKGEAPVVSTEMALKNILEIQKVLIDKKFSVFDQKEIDNLLMANLDKWGGNTTLAVSLALAKVAAQRKNMELYEYIREVYGYMGKKQSQVAFLMNVFNGGLHALRGNEKLGIDKPAIQEFMIYVKDDSYIKSIQKADNIYWKLKEVLFNYGFDNVHFGDEGGYSPRVINGLNIPDGFATTSDAYFYFLKETGIEEKIKKIVNTIDVNNIKDLQKKSKELQSLILKTDFPELFKKEVLENYEWLCKKYKVKNLAVAVRSSATSEDSAEASFAGQHESFLNVSGVDNLLYSIKHCIASLFTERAIAYRHNLKMHYSEVALSVGVQKMVRSDLACSGVMFSCDTESGFPDVVLINSSYGLGENIVKGRVESDQFYVFEKTLALGYMPLLEKRLGRKELTMVYGSKINEVKNLKTPKEKQEKFTLTDEEVLELAKYSLMIENHYGHPMDIEWAKDGKDKKLYVVQARPETVQSQKDVQVLKEYIFEDNSKRKEIAVGLSVGNKIGKGKASVIKDIKDISKFKKGDVLITHMTDPDWVPIMRMASAIVTESGSRTCFSKDTLLLTNCGFMTIADIVDQRNSRDIYVSSLNEKTLEVEWKKVMGGFKLKGNLHKINISQTGRSKNNILEVTPDHKFLTFNNRDIISEPIEQIVRNKKYILSTKEIPQFKYTDVEMKKYNLNSDLGYFLGGILTDGSLYLGEKSCAVAFIQKDIPSKQAFINKMNNCLEKLYGETFHKKPSYIGGGIIRGKLMRGEACQFCCFKKQVVKDLISKKNNICELAMMGDKEFLYNFLAGVIDGDGSFNKKVGSRINIYCSNDNLLRALVISCLKLGIGFQISNNRTIYNMQIVDEKITKILEYTQRVKGVYKREKFGTILFGAKQLLFDILEKVNYKGRINTYVLKNLLIDGEKIRKYIIPMIKGQAEDHELIKIINSSLKMLRVNMSKKIGIDNVYNIEVEDNHNYFVFTKYLTPIIVANCHAAIVGRELGLPTVVGAYNATKLVKDKQMVTVVCSEGEKGSVYAGDLKYSIKKTDLSKLAKPKVKITMNIGDPNQAFLNSFIPNDGVGLAREEFIVANHIKIHPMALVEYKMQDKNVKDKIDKLTYGYIDKKSFYIDKLAEGIGKITSAFYPKEVILRLSDFKTNEYRNLIGGERYELNEENPMIGFRGASRYYTDSFKRAFDLELEAIKKVIYVFGLKNLSIMVPFCRTVEEGKKVVKLIKESGIKDVKIYVMCEIPSNVILADKFLDIFDGMSIGSNDLTQLTLGIDRDANHLIQNISNENDEAVKELIKVVIEKCKARGKYIGICGQAPSDYPEFAKFLVENGIDSMSLNPDSVLKIRKELGG